jgi:2-phospho-L-lactate guanylyltransferase
MAAAAILPVKHFGAAKQRLSGALPAEARAALAQATVADVLESLGAAREVDLTIIVSGAIEQAPGARTVVIPDPAEQGQSPATLAGMTHAARLGYDLAVLVPGDCPLLEPAEVDDLIRAARSGGVVIVPDRHGTGTNALALDPHGPFEPAFGPDSCARHVAQAQARELRFSVEPVPSLALDLDTPDDLAALREAIARAPGRAGHTRVALERIEGRLTAAS